MTTGKQSKPVITKRWLEKCVRDGLTQEQMRDRFLEEFGEPRTRSAISVAMVRHGVKPPKANRKPDHSEYLPWSVKKAHQNRYEARMLRALSNTKKGVAIPVAESKRLAAWLSSLQEQNAVVHYDRDTEQGFWLYPREDADGKGYIHVRGIDTAA